jgi:hypothetical protein
MNKEHQKGAWLPKEGGDIYKNEVDIKLKLAETSRHFLIRSDMQLKRFPLPDTSSAFAAIESPYAAADRSLAKKYRKEKLFGCLPKISTESAFLIRRPPKEIIRRGATAPHLEALKDPVRPPILDDDVLDISSIRFDSLIPTRNNLPSLPSSPLQSTFSFAQAQEKDFVMRRSKPAICSERSAGLKDSAINSPEVGIELGMKKREPPQSDSKGLGGPRSQLPNAVFFVDQLRTVPNEVNNI